MCWRRWCVAAGLTIRLVASLVRTSLRQRLRDLRAPIWKFRGRRPAQPERGDRRRCVGRDRMKLTRLDLLRYGHLSDVTLAFPETALRSAAPTRPGSPRRAAIADALFGFGHRTVRFSPRCATSSA
jgi:hypothetical protein